MGSNGGVDNVVRVENCILAGGEYHSPTIMSRRVLMPYFTVVYW